MEKRRLSNGTVISRVQHPSGDGHVYYVDGGPEGMVLALDTYMISMPVLTACIAWEHDKEPPHGPDPKPIFNKTGFRF